MKRPVVLALNPSVDAEWQVDHVHWEEKNNVLSERRWAGGKGVNVARWLQHLGAKPLLLLPLGGETGRELAAQLRREKLATRIVPIAGHSRVNVIVTSSRQGQLRFNPLGPRLTAATWRRLVAVLEKLLPRAGVLVLSGALPPGLPASAYATLIRRARRYAVPVLLDCDGPALAAAVAAGPFLIKPNAHELSRWAETARLPRPKSKAELRAATRKLSRAAGGWVLLSNGSQPAWLSHDAAGQLLSLEPRRVRPLTTIGAGDAMLAAVAWAILRGQSPRQWLAAAVCTGTAATQCEAGSLPARRRRRHG